MQDTAISFINSIIIRFYLFLKLLQLLIRRAAGGFGLLLTDDRPVRVMQIKPNAPADVAGLRRHDVILRINEHDVSKLSADTVARVLR